MTSVLNVVFARPIAHRGYHDADNGVIENTPSAIRRAIDGNFGIEVDIQETADGRALVFHDFTLDRLAEGSGRVIDHTAPELQKIHMKTGTDRLWLLEDLFDLIDGKAPLIIEIKSLYRRDAQGDFVRHVVDAVASYRGPACIKSYDPDMLSIARGHRPEVLRGVVADGALPGPGYVRFGRVDRFILRHLLHAPRTRPGFISYSVQGLPQAGPTLLRRAFNMPIMCWTVRTRQQREKATAFADQIVFEGFNPDASSLG